MEIIIVIIIALVITGVVLFVKLSTVKDKFYLKIEDHLNKAEYNTALNLCLNRIDTDPNNYMIRGYLGQAYEGLKDYPHAVLHYQKAADEAVVQTNDRNASLLYAMKIAELDKKLKNYDEALEYYGQILEHDSQNIKALFGAGEIYFEKQNYHRAKSLLENLLEQKPDHLRGRFILAKIYVQIQLFHKAEEHLETMLADSMINHDFLKPKTCLLLSDVYIEQKKYEKAINVLRMILDDPEYFEDVLVRLIGTMVKYGSLDEALRMIDENMEKVSITKQGELTYFKGLAYVLQKKYYKGIMILMEAYKINSNYQDLKDLYVKYSKIINDPQMEYVFTDNDALREGFVRKMALSENITIVKRENFWLYKDNDFYYVLYIRPNTVIRQDLVDMNQILVTEFDAPYASFTIYTLYGIEKIQGEEPFNLKRIKVIEKDEFIKYIDSIKIGGSANELGLL